MRRICLVFFPLGEDLERSGHLEKGFEVISDAVVRDRPSPTDGLRSTAAGFEPYAGLILVSTWRNGSRSGKALDRYILARLVLRTTTPPTLSSLRRMVSRRALAMEVFLSPLSLMWFTRAYANPASSSRSWLDHRLCQEVRSANSCSCCFMQFSMSPRLQ